MATVLATIFAITTGFCAIKWYQHRQAALSLLVYIEKKGCTQPTSEELVACGKEVVDKQMERLKKKCSD